MNRTFEFLPGMLVSDDKGNVFILLCCHGLYADAYMIAGDQHNMCGVIVQISLTKVNRVTDCFGNELKPGQVIDNKAEPDKFETFLREQMKEEAKYADAEFFSAKISDYHRMYSIMYSAILQKYIDFKGEAN